MKKEKTIYTIEKEDYLVVDELEYQEKRYVFLVSIEKEGNIMIQERKESIPNELFGVKKELFYTLLNQFIERISKNGASR